jgi:hypothetical protein
VYHSLSPAILVGNVPGIKLSGSGAASFTVKKLECLKQAFAVNTLAWNNKIGLWCYFVGLRAGVMINRDSWGYSYLIVRGEILGFMKDELVRKHLPRMFSLIKNES